MKVIYVRDVIDLFDSAVEIYHQGQFVGSNGDVLGWVNNLVIESIVDEEGIIIIETQKFLFKCKRLVAFM